MPARLNVRPGDRYGRLVVIREVEQRNRRRYFLCRCDCGTETTARLTSMRFGSVKSCGCLQREQNKTAGRTHGLHGRGPYSAWHSMKQRCLNPNAVSYVHYGGRGITIHEPWLDYRPFYRWAMANGYRRGLSLERIDVNGNYEPENCTWIPPSEQPSNTRRCLRLTYKGETKILKHWAEQFGHSPKLVGNRLKRGWSLEKALLTPLDERMSRLGRRRV